MRLAALVVVLSACGPVLVGEEGPPSRDPVFGPSASPQLDAGSVTGPLDTEAGSQAEPPAFGDAVPTLTVTVEAPNCECFTLHAEAVGGHPPYRYEWDDGVAAQYRDICPDAPGLTLSDVALSVVAVDADARRSPAEYVRLRDSARADCMDPSAAPPATAMLCLENPSFEGFPAANLGPGGPFDAAPWSLCTNPTRNNAPSIGTPGIVAGIPAPVHGATFVALASDEQVSQALCSEPPDGALMALELDATRVTVGVPEGGPNAITLQVWSGQQEDCSLHEMLWESPVLETDWQRFCVNLQPSVPMTQITLRASTGTALDFVFVDNLNPVDACQP